MKPYGLFKHSIDIHRITDSEDSGGFPKEDFSYLKTIKANIQPYKSSEAIKTGRKWSNSMLKVYIKETIDVTMKDRIFYNNEYYDITENPEWIDTWQKLILSRTED